MLNKTQQVSELISKGEMLWRQGKALDYKKEYGKGDRLKALANKMFIDADKVYLSATLSEQTKIIAI